MKILLKIILIIFSISAFSQYKSGVIEYGIADINVTFKEGNIQNDFVKSIINAGKSQNFILKFNSFSSIFTLNESLTNENRDQQLDKYAKTLYTTSDVFYFDKKLNIFLRKTRDNIIIKDELSLDWEISQESKTINDYICYKAILKKNITNSKGVTKEIIITAWFTPSIPFNYGPIGYNGLPGLIIELTDRYTTYLAKKISFDYVEIKIEVPNGKQVTQEEYDKKILTNN